MVDGGGPPTRPCRPNPALRPRAMAMPTDAEQEVDVRVGRHRGELLAHRPRVPECAWHHQNTAFARLTDVSPRWLLNWLHRFGQFREGRNPDPVDVEHAIELDVGDGRRPDLPELGRPAPKGPPTARHRRLGVLGAKPPEELVQPCRRVVVPQRRRRAAGRSPPPLGSRGSPAVALGLTAAVGAINGLHGYLFRKGI